MPIRKTGAVTGRILGVESAYPEPEPAPGEAQEPEDAISGRPLPPAPDEDDD